MAMERAIALNANTTKNVTNSNMRRLIYFSIILLATSAFAQAPDTLHFEPMPDRWRIEPPANQRSARAWQWYNPFEQNIAKGDRPIFGQNTFGIITLRSATLAEVARVPTPSGVSTNNQNRANFFGNSGRLLSHQRFIATGELYHGDTSFKPRDWEIKAMLAIDVNHLALFERNNTNINPDRGTTRTDRQFSVQELFVEKHLINLSDRFDFISARAGIQFFRSDFRGFVFSDNNAGVRLFGNFANNKWQYNVAAFYLIEKDTNSELNTLFGDRNQQIFIANLYRQDWPVLGFTSQLSFHANRDRASRYTNDNGFPVRPAPIGANMPHAINAYYWGTTGSGHWGIWNLEYAFYQVLGNDTRNQLAGQRININAQMAALEISRDYDWQRWLLSFFYASGDANPTDATGRAFDAILDSPSFSGGAFSFWNTQALGLLGVNLVQRNSLIPNLRPGSKFEGQSNFVHPGIIIINAAHEAELIPKLRSVVSLSYLRFVDTTILRAFANQGQVRNSVGLDFGAGVIYRPWLNNNAIFVLSFTALQPLGGFTDLFEKSSPQGAVRVDLVFTY